MRRSKKMRPCSLLAIGLLLLFGLSNCTFPPGSNSPGSTSQIDWVDFVQFGGMRYLAQDKRSLSQSRPLQEENLGSMFATVALKVAGNVTDPGYQIHDGDAAFLDPGTKVYRVKGYQPWFRLAAHRGGALVLYEVDHNPKAKRGADLFDIDGKVQYIGINMEPDGIIEHAPMKDPHQVAALVRMIDAAPLRAHRPDQKGTYFLALHLLDKTTVIREYWDAPDTVFGDLTLPKAFQTAIAQAVLSFDP